MNLFTTLRSAFHGMTLLSHSRSSSDSLRGVRPFRSAFGRDHAEKASNLLTGHPARRCLYGTFNVVGSYILIKYRTNRFVLLALCSIAVMCAFAVPSAVFASEVGSVRFLVELDDNNTAGNISALHQEEVAEVIDITTQKSSDLDDWIIVEVSEQEAFDVAHDIAMQPEVKHVEQESVYVAQAVDSPNDPRFLEQYGLNSSAFPAADINALEAWEVTTGSSDVVIAIIDSGVDLTHEDLRDKIWINEGEIADNGVDDDGNGYVDDLHGWDFAVSDDGDNYPNDENGHGTHVAGIAAASSNNGIGVTGVSWGSRIMPLRVLGSGYGWEGDIIEAVTYAVDNGADIINLSLAGVGSGAMVDAVEYAYTNGVVVVAAAGNHRVDTGIYSIYPACAQKDGVNMVLGVGGTDEEGQPASFSNYGSCVDISAPGDDILSTKTGDRYGDLTGTSMSSPFAAGVAGLYLSLHPGAPPSEVIAALMKGDSFTGEDADVLNELYKGRLNAARVLGVPSYNPPLSGGGEEGAGDSGSGDNGGSSSSGESDGGDEGGGDSGGGGGGGDCCPHDDSSAQDAPHSAKATRGKSAGHIVGVQRVKPNLALIPKINAAFRSVFGHNPTRVEHSYWFGRVKRGEKRSFTALQGAMAWHKAHGRTYSPLMKGGQRGVVAGATSMSLIHKINAIHRQAYGRNPTVSEHTYWMGRVVRGEKTTEIGLLGAMIFHRIMGIQH